MIGVRGKPTGGSAPGATGTSAVMSTALDTAPLLRRAAVRDSRTRAKRFRVRRSQPTGAVGLFWWAVSGPSVLRAICMATVVSATAAAARVASGSSSKDTRRGEDILFAVRSVGRDGHWYANFGHHINNPNSMQHGPGGASLRLLKARTGELTTIIEDAKGTIRDPHVHYDGRKILFSYRRGGTRHFHLYEIGVDGTGLRQITDGPFDDTEPIYLPDGDIMFVSSRCNRWVACWFVQVGTLYRCGPDGRNMRMISSNIVNDNTPWMLPDGRVLYMRWEYVDRSQVRFHHLWTVNPDGTGQMVYYGNQNPRTAMLDAKPVPVTGPDGDAGKVVVVFSPGHGRKEHAGFLTMVDPGLGPDEKSFAKRLNLGRGVREGDCRDPYALSEGRFLFANGQAVYVTDGRGHTDLVHALPKGTPGHVWVHEPRPVRPREREALATPRVDLGKDTGRLILMDVAHGRNMQKVKRGDIRKLLVLEQLPKPANFSGAQEPMSVGGTFTLKRVLGTVPVEPDGSAYMELPAMRSLFFVALDENDMSVKRMQSFVTLQPGETTSCVGCHERRTETPPSPVKPTLAALERPPSRTEPIPGVPDVFDFPRDVQPILDAHCVKCHNHEKRKGGVILTGDRNEWYSQSYFTLFAKDQVSDGNNRDGNRPVRDVGSSASALMKKIDGSHNKVKVSPHEHTMIRLWIESGAAYPGTYAALGTGMVNVDRRAIGKIFGRRCAACHRKGVDSLGDAIPGKRLHDTRAFRRRMTLYNLTRPEKSLLLMAPLAKAAGGNGLCGKKTKEGELKQGKLDEAAVFAADGDPDYQAMLGVIRRAAEKLNGIKRFDMPGFRPNEHYVREMKSYGVLPRTLGRNHPIDVYKTDRAYWRSLWHRPSSSTRREPLGRSRGGRRPRTGERPRTSGRGSR